jgi:hypothetical protein
MLFTTIIIRCISLEIVAKSLFVYTQTWLNGGEAGVNYFYINHAQKIDVRGINITNNCPIVKYIE